LFASPIFLKTPLLSHAFCPGIHIVSSERGEKDGDDGMGHGYGAGSGFALVVVLFILLIIVGTAYVR
jgi:uncharacterized protein (TIGR01732 family)